jgi:UDP-2,3-diacylglucosamine pyrophosphatase LpxH
MRRDDTGEDADQIVVSDLHLGDGDPIAENWRAAQQSAWESLLRTLTAQAPGEWEGAGKVELIVNGDCFDCLAAAPALGERDATDIAAGEAKIARIVAAHPAWFAALKRYLAAPGRRVTFLIGNHDAELAFARVRANVRRAIDGPPGAVRFCLARAYRSAPDVVIEHGCQVDPWNALPDLWHGPDRPACAGPDELEREDTSGSGELEQIALPWGSRYYYRVFAPIARRFPYIEALLPTPEQYMVLALLCLYAPELVVGGTQRARSLREHPAALAPQAALAQGSEREPAALFRAALPEMAALRAEVWGRMGASMDPSATEAAAAHIEAILAGLAQGELPALRAIFGGDGATREGLPALDAAAAAEMLGRDGTLRLALCGHTHAEGMYTLPSRDGAGRAFLNTGTWYSRLAAPAPEAIDRQVAAWLRDPFSGPCPLAPATEFTYAVLRVRAGLPTEAELRVAQARDG